MPRVDLPIFSGAKQSRFPFSSTHRLVNLYPESTPNGRGQAVLQRTPGLRLVARTQDDGPMRAWKQISAHEALAVIGFGLYRVRRDGVTRVGGVAIQDGAHVSIANSGDEALIVDGVNGWVYSRGKVERISDPDFPRCNSVDFLAGRFVVNEVGTGRLWWSDIYQGKIWNALAFATAESVPDNIVRLFADNGRLVLYGETGVEEWAPVADADLPYAPTSFTATIGLHAWGSVAVVDNAPYWISDKKQVVRGNGTQAQIVSTRQIEAQWERYSRMDDAVGWGYVQEGHAFYCLDFPSGDATWIFDASTGEWHERASFQRNRWRAGMGGMLGGITLAGDNFNGDVYRLDTAYFLEDDGPYSGLFQWELRTPVVAGQGARFTHSMLELDVSAGLGLETQHRIEAATGTDEPALHGRAATITVDWTEDDGRSWRGSRNISAGAIGKSTQPVRLWRLGQSRRRAYRLRGRDPVPIQIAGLYLDYEVGR